MQALRIRNAPQRCTPLCSSDQRKPPTPPVAPVPSWVQSMLRPRPVQPQQTDATHNAQLRQLREAEVMHARWAMLGIVGLILPDLLSAPLILLPDLLLSERLLPAAIVILVGIGSVEAYRAAYNMAHTDEAPDERVYPARRLDMLPSRAEDAPGVGVFASWLGGVPGWLSGGWWMARRSMSVQQFEDMKARELSNGRLAMVSFVGVYTAALLTGKGPITLLVQHLADPVNNTILQTLSK